MARAIKLLALLASMLVLGAGESGICPHGIALFGGVIHVSPADAPDPTFCCSLAKPDNRGQCGTVPRTQGSHTEG
jgi:hypothetical protein